MIGIVFYYDAETQDGVIVGDDTRRYRFSRCDYRSQHDPVEGVVVDFTIEGTTAKNIIVLLSAPAHR
jgi:hypothetical protein